MKSAVENVSERKGGKGKAREWRCWIADMFGAKNMRRKRMKEKVIEREREIRRMCCKRRKIAFKRGGG